MFNLIGYGERAGSGVPDIYAVWREAGYAEPTVEEQFGGGQPNRMIVTLPLVEREESLVISEKQPEKQPENSPESKRSDIIEKRTEMVLELIKANPSISRAKIAKELDITDSQAKTVIIKLKKDRKIHREGSDTDGKWIVDTSE